MNKSVTHDLTAPEQGWSFDLDEYVKLRRSGEQGRVVSRAEHLNGEDEYRIEYVTSTGRQVLAWWPDSSITH